MSDNQDERARLIAWHKAMADEPNCNEAKRQKHRATADMLAEVSLPKNEQEEITAMVDAAMAEMKNIYPPLRRNDCERLIRAALRAEDESIKYLIEAEWPDRFGVPLEVTDVQYLGGGKIGIRVKPHSSRESLLSDGLGCTRSHPHDEMSPMCKLRTEIAKLKHKIAVMEADANATIDTCPKCGLHDVSLERTCHNSACAGYAESVTVYEGWKQNTKPKQAPYVAKPLTEEQIYNLWPTKIWAFAKESVDFARDIEKAHGIG